MHEMTRLEIDRLTDGLCPEDGGEIVWDEDRGCNLCTGSCGKAKCATCPRNLAVDEEVYCDRCRDRMGMTQVEQVYDRRVRSGESG